MSKRARHDPPVQFKCMIPASLKRDIDLLLMDPTRGQIKYGSLAALVTRLLRAWVNRQVKRKQMEQGVENA